MRLYLSLVPQGFFIMSINAAFSMSQLAKLAQSDNPRKREQLYLALGSLCAINPAENAANGQSFGEIMFLLNGQASEEIRQQASNLLCEKDCAPKKLILAWANDIIPIANPVLLKSPVLDDDDLIKVAQNASLFHRLAIADRPEIGPGITDTLVGFSEPEVLIAMTANQTADMSMETFASCVRISRRHASLRMNLTDREDLPRSLLPSLFAYSDPQQREGIAERFGIDVDNFSDVVRQAVLKQNPPNAPSNEKNQELEIARYVAKLAKSEKLDTDFIVKAAATEKTTLFEHAIAHLADVPVDYFRTAMSRSPSVALALSCQAARIERGLYPTIHHSLTDNGYFNEELSSEIAVKAAKAFGGHSPAAASVALRLMARNA